MQAFGAMLLFQPDARILLIVLACLARATGLTGSAAGRAWKAVAAGNTPPVGSRAKVVSSAGVTLDVDNQADWPPEGAAGNQGGGCLDCPGSIGPSDGIYAVSADASVVERNLSVARFVSQQRVPTGWLKEPAGGAGVEYHSGEEELQMLQEGDAFWAVHREVDAASAAVHDGELYPVEAKAITEQLRRKGATGSSILGHDLGEDATNASIQWTRLLALLGLAGIVLGLVLPTDNWEDRMRSGPSLNNIQGDTGSSPAFDTQSNKSENSEPAAAPPINQSATPTGEDTVADSCSSPQTTSAGEHSLMTLAIHRERSGPIPVEERSPTLHKLGVTLVQHRWKVIFVWAGLCLCQVPLAAQIRSILSLNFYPTPQMPSYEARERFLKQFPKMAQGAEFSLVLETKEEEAFAPPAPNVDSVHNNSDHNNSDKGVQVAAGAPHCPPGPDGKCKAGDCCTLEETCLACPSGFTERNVSAGHCGAAGFRRCNVMGYAQIMDMPGLFNFSVRLRDELNNTGELVEFTSPGTAKLDWGIDISSGMVAPAGNVITIQFRIVHDTASKPGLLFAGRVHRVVDQLLPLYLPRITFTGLLGVPEFVRDSIKAAEESLVTMDAITLPVAVFLLWWVLRGCKLLVALLCTMVVSTSCCFGTLYLVGVWFMPVDLITPELVMSILIAMNIDYALFLHTRFRTEVLRTCRLTPRAQRSPAWLQTIADEAAVAMLATAGFTVVTSGTVLWLVFTSLIYFPIGAVKSLGIGCALCLIFTIAVNVTLVPALLSAFPSFFMGDFLKTDGTARAQQGSSFDWAWKWCAKKTTTFPNNAILALSVIVLCSGTALAAARMQVQSSFIGMVPRGSSSATALQLLSEAYGWGSAVPVEVLLEPAPSTKDGVLSAEFWNASQKILHDIQSTWPGGPSALTVQSISYVDGQFVPWQIAEVCLGNKTLINEANPIVRTVTEGAHAFRSGAQQQLDLCHKLQFLRNRYVNAEATATYAQLFPVVDPLGTQDQKWLEKGRERAKLWQEASGVAVTWSGYVVELQDVKDGVSEMVPQELLVIVSTVLILGLAFRSATVPLRSVLTLLATISVVYGSAVLAFQDGMLDFLGIPGISGRNGAVQFLCPVVVFPICAGICLDYDIFLITHIGEYREAGCPPITAIQCGVRSIGGIIAAAGLIMTVAFSGHIATNLEGMNCFGFFLVVTVLFDAFVMQPIFTPACMSLIGRYNWWPGKLFYIKEQEFGQQ